MSGGRRTTRPVCTVIRTLCSRRGSPWKCSGCPSSSLRCLGRCFEIRVTCFSPGNKSFHPFSCPWPSDSTKRCCPQQGRTLCRTSTWSLQIHSSAQSSGMEAKEVDSSNRWKAQNCQWYPQCSFWISFSLRFADNLWNPEAEWHYWVFILAKIFYFLACCM